LPRRTLLAVATLVAIGLPVSAQSNNQPQWVLLRYDFSEGSSGWLSSFTDYSLDIADLERIAEIRFRRTRSMRTGAVTTCSRRIAPMMCSCF